MQTQNDFVIMTNDELKTYGGPCAKNTSPYGKFIKNYLLEKSNKTSKIQILIDNDSEKRGQIANMSKYQFIKEYLLLKSNNDYVYTIKDFTNVKEWSFKGFLYESIWDIFFKCNIVEPYNHNINHMDGQIESLRDKKTNKKEINNNLKVIDNMYQYLSDNKIQSASTGGVSDITLQFRNIDQIYQPICRDIIQNKSNFFVFISSKFFKNEKAISKYDTDVIKQAAKMLQSNYEILLLVNDRKSLQEKMKRTLKKHIVESITKIYDITDLEHYLVKFRSLMSRLMIQSYDKNWDSIFKKYFVLHQKPLLPLSFSSQYLFAASHYVDISKPLLFSSNFLHVLIEFFLIYVWNHTHKNILVICNNKTKEFLNYTKNKFYIVDSDSFKYNTKKFSQIKISDISSFDIIFVITDSISKTFYKKIKNFGDVKPVILLNVYYNTHQSKTSIYKYLLNYFYKTYTWYINDYLLLKYSNDSQYQKILMNKYTFLLNETITSIYGNQYYNGNYSSLKSICDNISNENQDFPDINFFTNKTHKMDKKYDIWTEKNCTNLSDGFLLDNFHSLVSLIYGEKNNLNQNFLIVKRLANYSDSTPNTHLWLLSSKIINKCFAIFKENMFVSNKYHFVINNNKIDLSDDEEYAFKNNKTLVVLTSNYINFIPCLDTLFVFDNNVQAVKVIYILSKIIYFKNKNYINIIDFDPQRVSLLSDIIYPVENKYYIDPNVYHDILNS